MKRTLLTLSLALATSFSLSACAAAQNKGAPSLAKRPVEGRFDVAPPAVVVSQPGPLPADLGERLARWESDAAVAQQAISRLTATRAPLTAALADIDRLYIERSVDEAIDGLPDIYALRDRLAEMGSAQDAVLEALSEQLPGK